MTRLDWGAKLGVLTTDDSERRLGEGVPLYGGNGGGTCVDQLVLEDLTEHLSGTWWLQKMIMREKHIYHYTNTMARVF